MSLLTSACSRTRIAALLPALMAVAAPGTPVETLRSTGGLPAHVVGTFREPLGFQQADTGQYFVFDRRAHAVFTIDGDAARKIVDIGAEPGRLLDPSAFDSNPADGSFVVADAPLRRPRIQWFTASGSRMAGFTLADREQPRIMLDTMVLNGIGSLQYTGASILINQPETGALVTELGPFGAAIRSFGALRATGQEADRNVHLALNTGRPLVDPGGGYYFVFSAGIPIFRKYDAHGTLLFERHVEGPEVDDYLRTMPSQWPARQTVDGDMLPVVPPAVRTAAVDRKGRLWIALTAPFVYVYDGTGEKLRTVQLRGGTGVVAPDSLFFAKDGRLLVTPGCYYFHLPDF
jgi:hypothetical protein